MLQNQVDFWGSSRVFFQGFPQVRPSGSPGAPQALHEASPGAPQGPPKASPRPPRASQTLPRLHFRGSRAPMFARFCNRFFVRSCVRFFDAFSKQFAVHTVFEHVLAEHRRTLILCTLSRFFKVFSTLRILVCTMKVSWSDRRSSKSRSQRSIEF